MSQLHSHGTTHRCQIDCTNHDEVITALQLKSKDLYYFWRNYEWLYTRYYALLNSQKQQPPLLPKQNNESYKIDIQNLQNENDRLLKQNKRLKLQIQTYKKQLSEDNFSKFEAEYKKEINIWKNKANEYELINQKLSAQNNKLKNTINANYEQFQTQKERLSKQYRKSKQTIVQLQQTIDEMRRVPAPGVRQPEGTSRVEVQEFGRKQATLVANSIRNISSEAERLVASQFDGCKIQLEERLAEMLAGLSQRQLQTIIVSVQHE